MGIGGCIYDIDNFHKLLYNYGTLLPTITVLDSNLEETERTSDLIIITFLTTKGLVP